MEDKPKEETLKPVAEKPVEEMVIDKPVVETKKEEAPNIIKKPNKARKRKKQREGPKFPLTGYVRYVNDHREEVRLKNLNLNAIEITKLIAEEWNKMPEDVKKPYLVAAEIDKERYSREIQEYKKLNEAKRVAAAAEAAVIVHVEPTVVPALPPPPPTTAPITEKEEKFSEKPLINGIKTGDYDIPIFTDEFLDHNKTIDSELRTLRKSHTDYEQQNAVLEKHVENMRNGIDKLDNEMCSLKDNNKILQNYIDKLKEKLTNSLSGLSGSTNHPNGANLNNIEDYMTELQTSTNSGTLNKAKDIIRKLDLQIQV